ncbi:hypothetical protein BG000_003715 [Podila horticola]|nr:hypothetical protein BG000_003715 [Podila horticola]
MSSGETEIEHEPEPTVSPSEGVVYTSTAKPKPPLTADEWANMDKPKVLIVGAGIGGLFLANLLHKAKVPFTVVERAREVKNFGSAMSLGSSVSQLFEQIGILEEFKKNGKPNIGLEAFTPDRESSFLMDFSKRPQYCGATEMIVARPDLYDLLLRQVPQENIHMGKKVLSFEQNDLGVMIRCNDNTTYHGDILVGADGAHSAVRQHLFKVLKAKKLLPSSDEGDLPFDCVCLVGQTKVLDPEAFPDIKLSHSKFNAIGQDEFSWVTSTTCSNTICWVVIQHLNKETLKQHDSFHNSEWGSEAAEAMCKQIRHFKIPGGKDGNLTLGDLIDKTPKHLISKVMLEEKIFSTWHGGRTVLLGDGAGALTAIHDCVALANWISTLHKPKLADIEAIFAEYQAERLPVAKEALATTKLFKSTGGKSILAALSRHMFRHMPAWLMKLVLIKMVSARPQLSFLPQVKDTGSAKPKYQRSLEKTLAIHKARAAKKEAVSSSAEPTVAV